MKRTPIVTHTQALSISLRLGHFLGLLDNPRRPLSGYIRAIMLRIINWFVTTAIIIACTLDFFLHISDDLGEVSYNLGFIFPMITHNFKSLVVYKRQKALYELIDKIHDSINKLKYSSDLGVITEIQVAVTYLNFDFSFFVFASIFICLSIFAPIKLSLRTRILPVRAVFPFDEKPSPWFEIIYGLEFYGIMIENLWFLIYDPAIMGLVRWINIQLVILQSNFRHCNDLNTPRANFLISEENYNIALKYSYFKTPEERLKIRAYIPFTEEEVHVEKDSFTKRFKLCVFHHRRLINIFKEYNNLFSFIFFIQIISNCLLICIGLFQMALGLKMGRNVFRDVIVLGSGLIQPLYWSIYGNFLIKEHEELQKSIYECGWEDNIKKENRQIILIGLLQGFTPMVISAGYIFVFSMESYLSIVQKAYSIFAILNTMMSDG